MSTEEEKVSQALVCTYKKCRSHKIILTENILMFNVLKLTIIQEIWPMRTHFFKGHRELRFYYITT